MSPLELGAAAAWHVLIPALSVGLALAVLIFVIVSIL